MTMEDMGSGQEKVCLTSNFPGLWHLLTDPKPLPEPVSAKQQENLHGLQTRISSWPFVILVHNNIFALFS